MLCLSVSLLVPLRHKASQGLLACWPIFYSKYHLSSFQLLPSNCRAARCSSFILSFSSFFTSTSSVSSAGTTTGAASAIGGDLPERVMNHTEISSNGQVYTQGLGQNAYKVECVELYMSSDLGKRDPGPHSVSNETLIILP